MIDLRSLALEQLIQRCHTTTVQYLRTHDAGGDSSYCLELFRRALQDHDESAWAFIYTTYSTEEFLGEHYILKWVRSWLHGRHGAMIRSAFTEEEIVHEVWLRFANSDAARAFSFETMSQLMSYLRRLINNFMMDVARRRAPHFIESSTDEEAAHLEQVIRAVPDRSNDFDSIISEGESMEEMLREKGYQIGKSSIHRYGQKIERRFAAIKASTEAARMLTEGASDDQDARSEAVIALVQTELFESIINLQEAGDEDIDPADRIGLLSSAAKNIATLARASVNQKKFRLEEQARIEREAREKLIAEQEEKLQELRGADGMSEQMEARIRRILLGKE